MCILKSSAVVVSFVAAALISALAVQRDAVADDVMGAAPGERGVNELQAERNVSAIVRLPDGSPAEGAVVISSAGGQGISDAEGTVRFLTPLDPEADAVAITAVATNGTSTYMGQSVIRAPGDADVGIITLQSGASCETEWLPTFGATPGTNGNVYAVAVFDDGSGDGPALYMGGSFTTAGGVTAGRVAKWDGVRWLAVGGGMSGGTNDTATVESLIVHDDGSGAALYAGGRFTIAGGVAANHIAKWDGSTWLPLGGGLDNPDETNVHTMVTFDDGSGPALFVGGRFTSAGGAQVKHLAKWDGATWMSVGHGVSGFTHSRVYSLAVAEDTYGRGPGLYVGGSFSKTGDSDAMNIARWDGTSLSALGAGVNGTVRAIVPFDDGSCDGTCVYVGGEFSAAGGSPAPHVARWDPTSSTWSTVGDGMSHGVYTLAIHDDGFGPALYAGGGFLAADGMTVNRVAVWDGTAWAGLGSGMSAAVEALLPHSTSWAPDGGGLLAAGAFVNAGGAVCNFVAQWDGTAWAPLSEGPAGCAGSSCTPAIYAMEIFNDGSSSGPALYVGGNFTQIGGIQANNIAKWDGHSWSALGGGVNGVVHALAVGKPAKGETSSLFVGGEFIQADGSDVNRVARWDGADWHGLGTACPSTHAGGCGTNGAVRALIFVDDILHIGGSFTLAGGIQANRIARWDGASWFALGTGLDGSGSSTSVRALAHYGGALYVGGTFLSAGGEVANSIAKWDGASWAPLGTGVNASVESLAVYDDGQGAGPRLYVGGFFTLAGGVPTQHLGRWNGTSWSMVPGVLTGAVRAFAIESTPESDSLVVGGDFLIAGGFLVNRIAKWNGSNWTALGPGLPDSVFALAFDSGLVAGGHFPTSHAGDSFLARWGCIQTELDVSFDIRPSACTNPFNPSAQGVLPAAILGDADLDVTFIDTSTLAMVRAENYDAAAVFPLNGPPGPGMQIEDVGSPLLSKQGCPCHSSGLDGVNDLALKFSIPEMVSAFDLASLPAGETVELKITGQLLDGSLFSGTDCISIVGASGQNCDIDGDGMIGVADLLALLAAWGPCMDQSDCAIDFDGDGVVGILDLLTMLANWS